MDSDVVHLKQAVTDKLRRNGTLARIQAELRCAVFLAIERDENNEQLELKVEEGKPNHGYSIIYHFLRQNRFLATAAVFEKETHQKIVSLEELKKQYASTYGFQFSGDTISLSNLTEGNLKTAHSTEIENNDRNNINSNYTTAIEENDNRQSAIKALERQQRKHCGSDKTFKSSTSNSEISNGENGILNIRPKDRAFEKVNDCDDKEEQCKKRSNSDLESLAIFEQRETPNTPSTTIFSDEQQFTKYMKSLPSSYPRKLPPIKPTTINEPIRSIKLPSISSLNNTLNQTGTVPFPRSLNTTLNSPSSNKTETDEEITEEIIPDDLLQSGNETGSTISF